MLPVSELPFLAPSDPRAVSQLPAGSSCPASNGSQAWAPLQHAGLLIHQKLTYCLHVFHVSLHGIAIVDSLDDLNYSGDLLIIFV